MAQYTEEDTERVRQLERDSSAGISTQPLGALPITVPATQVGRAAPRFAGLALIVMGLFVFLMQMLGDRVDIEGGMVLFTIASCFLFFAFWKRIYGLLIPGAILAGIGMGVPFADLTDGVSVLWGLALGFLSILALGRSMFGVHTSWPIFPAIPLFAVGVLVLASNLPGFLAGGLIILPMLLIAAGLFLGFRR